LIKEAIRVNSFEKYRRRKVLLNTIEFYCIELDAKIRFKNFLIKFLPSEYFKLERNSNFLRLELMEVSSLLSVTKLVIFYVVNWLTC
jgi:hypothetical protein